MLKQFKNFLIASGAWAVLMAGLSQAHAAPGFPNDVCGAPEQGAASAAVAKRAQLLRQVLIWPHHATALLSIQSTKEEQSKYQSVTAQDIREALIGVRRSAYEAFADNNGLEVSIRFHNGTPTLELDCGSRGDADFTGFQIPLDPLFLDAVTQQFAIRALKK